MREVTPETFLISSPQLRAQPISDYLTAMGAEEWYRRVFGKALDSGVSLNDAEALVEIAGRLCYRSWVPGLNANVTKIREASEEYLANILSSGHGCYDAETEVLTATGWKAWPLVDDDDLLATRREDGVIEYQRPTGLTSYYHRGLMYRVDGRGVDLLVTPNHNMLVCPTTTREGRRKESFQLMPAQELGHRSHAYLKSGEWVSTFEAMSKDEARLLGFSIGDGYLPPNGNVMNFHLRRERKIAWLKGVVSRLGWKMDENGDKFRVHLPYYALMAGFDDIYTDPDREKKIPYRFLFQDRSVLEGLYEGLMQADGHVGRTGDSFDTTSDLLVGQFQALCLHIGLAANVCYRREDRSGSYGERPLTHLSVIRRELKPEVNKFTGSVGFTSWIQDWEGDVYCAEVPNHTLYVRRNGKPVWCGNSVLEHATFTFIFHNVSRVFTAELNRHRAGCAISEQSLRFVRLTDIPMWWPEWTKNPKYSDLMAGAADLIADMERWQVEAAEVFKLDETKVCVNCEGRAMVTLTGEAYYGDRQTNTADQVFGETVFPCPKCGGKGEVSAIPFSKKKFFTSFMRRFAPLGLATEEVWSVNIRAIRHIISMRTAEGAEEEIRIVAGQMAEIMKVELPNLFGDYEQNESGAWATSNWKV